MSLDSDYSLEDKFSDLTDVVSTIGETLEDQLTESASITPEVQAEMLGFLGGLTVYFNAINKCSDPDNLYATRRSLQSTLPENKTDKAEPIMDDDMLFDYLLIHISDTVKKQIGASINDIILGAKVEFSLATNDSISFINKGALITFVHWSENITTERLKKMKQDPPQFIPQFTARILN